MEPASVAVCQGAEAELTAVAFGLAPIEYQWYQGESGDTSTPLAGETTDTLAVTPDETTPYWVRVTNPCGSTDSATAVVTVNLAPTITLQPASAAVCLGVPALLTVNATGTATLTYQWYQGESGDTGTPLVGETSNTLAVAPETTTPYWVRVTNGCGSEDSDTATVTVNLAPEITVEPVGGEYDGLAPVVLSVTATGTAPLTYQWQRFVDGGWESILGATSDTYDAAPEEDTDYRVLVTNPCGTAVSDTATVTVIVSPFEGTGFTYVDALSSNLYSDQAGTTPIARSDGDSIRNAQALGGALITQFNKATANKFFYGIGIGARGINGFPVIYGGADEVAETFDARTSGGTVVNASDFITGKDFVFLGLFRRVANDNNVVTFQIAGNRPGKLQEVTGNMQAFGFLTGFVSVNVAVAPGVHVIGWRFKGTNLEVSVDGGTWQQVAQTADWSAEASPISMIRANVDWQTWGLIDGDPGDPAIAAIIADLKTRGGI